MKLAQLLVLGTVLSSLASCAWHDEARRGKKVEVVEEQETAAPQPQPQPQPEIEEPSVPEIDVPRALVPESAGNEVLDFSSPDVTRALPSDTDTKPSFGGSAPAPRETLIVPPTAE